MKKRASAKSSTQPVDSTGDSAAAAGGGRAGVESESIRSVLTLLRQIQSGELSPSSLATPERQAVVEHLTAEGYSICEIAEILKASERTIARDRKAIRDANAIARDPKLLEQMVGQLLLEAQLHRRRAIS